MDACPTRSRHQIFTQRFPQRPVQAEALWVLLQVIFSVRTVGLNCPSAAAPAAPNNKVLKCRLGSKPCQDGQGCVLLSHFCDGEKDCRDGSDEEGCGMYPETFLCTKCGRIMALSSTVSLNLEDGQSVLCPGSQICVKPTQMCDGRRDCPDGFDEKSFNPHLIFLFCITTANFSVITVTVGAASHRARSVTAVLSAATAQTSSTVRALCIWTCSKNVFLIPPPPEQISAAKTVGAASQRARSAMAALSATTAQMRLTVGL
uniref:Uncharacterized protein n=1 Tax=Fundulus heteroclitus TaxID=8078 RepID=A0A3Q2PCM6_FUNHE